MKAPRFAGIVERAMDGEGPTRRVQEVACCRVNCHSTLAFPVTNGRKPPDVVANLARRRGWTVNEPKGLYVCPNHKKELPVTTSEAKPRQPTLDQRRAIFREIDESYANKSYADGVTDQNIGIKLAVPWAWVKAIREENFGPAGTDPAILAIQKTLTALQERIKAAEDSAMADFDRIVKTTAELHQQVEFARAALNKIES